MKEQAIRRINKLGKGVGIITKILRIIAEVGAVLVLIVGVAALVSPEFREEFKSTISVDVEVEMDGKELTDYMVVEQKMEELALTELDKIIGDNLLYLYISFLLEMMVTIFVVYLFEKLCVELGKCTSPFECAVTSAMKRLAHMLVFFIVFGVLKDFIDDSVISTMSSLSLDISIWDVAFVLMIEMLLYIFQYGAVLQQESDETL